MIICIHIILKFVLMETLKVITVSVPDLDNSGKMHIAYTVYGEAAGTLRVSAGWSLKDAIEYYSREYDVGGENIRLYRPFERQEYYLRRHGISM